MIRRLGLLVAIVALGTAAVLVAPDVARPTEVGGAGVAAISPLPVASPSPIVSPSPEPSPRPSPSPEPLPSPPPSASPSPDPLVIPSPSIHPHGPIDPAAIDAALRKARSKYAIPGISAAILWSDGTTWTGTSGYADVGTKRRVTPDTVFAAASVSKTFTAALILSLVDEGKLGLDDRVRARVAGLSTRKVSDAVTIRMLLEHTSGIADFFTGPGIDKALQRDKTKAWTAAEALKFVGAPYFPAGTDWHYSNTNYLLLGLVAEAVTGHPLADELHDRFIEPFDLAATTIQGAEPASGRIASAYRFTSPDRKATPVKVSDRSGIVPFASVVTASGAAGSIASTPTDLARWAAALYGGRAIGPEMLATMMAAVDETKPLKPSVPYGLGIQRVKVAGHVAYGHSGRFLGSRSLIRYVPALGMAIAVMSNTNRGDLAPVVEALVRATIVPPPAAPPVPSPSPSPVPPA